MKKRSDYSDEDLRTAKQWLQAGMFPVDGVTGEELWTNGSHQVRATYYRPSEVRHGTQDELNEARAPERERRRRQAQKRREVERKEREQRQKAERANHLLVAGMTAPVAVIDNPSGIICMDAETTGLDTWEDELLQISIIDGDGNVMLNTYIRPYIAEQWPDAQQVNHISPEMVEKAPELHEVLPRIRAALASAKTIVGYNIDFDLGFLPCKPNDDSKIIDVMREFAPIFGEWSDYFGGYKWQKLTTCARYYGYEFKAHDALEDTKATLFCWRQIQQNKE